MPEALLSDISGNLIEMTRTIINFLGSKFVRHQLESKWFLEANFKNL